MARILLVVTILFVSCRSNDYGTDFLIVNDSSKTIDSMFISTINDKSRLKIESIEHNTSIPAFLDMKNIDKVDGTFKFVFFTDSLKVIRNYGYYTNGMRHEQTIEVNYLSDSIIFRSIRYGTN